MPLDAPLEESLHQQQNLSIVKDSCQILGFQRVTNSIEERYLKELGQQELQASSLSQGFSESTHKDARPSLHINSSEEENEERG